eukprot:612622-Hanusia_phi.AAC.4
MRTLPRSGMSVLSLTTRSGVGDISLSLFLVFASLPCMLRSKAEATSLGESLIVVRGAVRPARPV